MRLQTTDNIKCNDTHLQALNSFTDVDFSSKRNLLSITEDKERGAE